MALGRVVQVGPGAPLQEVHEAVDVAQGRAQVMGDGVAERLHLGVDRGELLDVVRQLQVEALDAARGLALLGDVLRHRHARDDAALLVAHGHDLDAVVPPGVGDLERAGAPFQGPEIERLDLRTHLRGHHLLHRPAHERLGPRQARAVGHQVTEVAVEEQERAVGEVVRGRAVGRFAGSYGLFRTQPGPRLSGHHERGASERDDGHERAQQHDQRRPLRAGAGGALAQGEQDAFLAREVVDGGAHLAHQLFTLVGERGLERRGVRLRAPGRDGSVQRRHTHLDRRAQAAESALLGRVVRDQHAEVIEARGDVAARDLVAVEVPFGAGESVAPPRRLRARDVGVRRSQGCEHFVRMSDPLGSLDQGTDAADGHGADTHQQHDAQQERSDHAPIDRPVRGARLAEESVHFGCR